MVVDVASGAVSIFSALAFLISLVTGSLVTRPVHISSTILAPPSSVVLPGIKGFCGSLPRIVISAASFLACCSAPPLPPLLPPLELLLLLPQPASTKATVSGAATPAIQRDLRICLLPCSLTHPAPGPHTPSAGTRNPGM